MSISFKLHIFIITGYTPTNILYSRGCANKVSRPGLEKGHINAIYIPPLQWFARIAHATPVLIGLHPPFVSRYRGISKKNANNNVFLNLV